MYNGVDSGQHFKKALAGTKEVLQTFMLDHNFTRTCMERPPAIGEEQGHNSADDHSNSSVSGKSEVSNATPRRADADLGYEPEGSASALPPHDRWKISLHNMLEDRDGVYLFNEYLREIKEEKILDCWLAMKGFQDFGLKTYRSASSSAASSTTGPLSNDLHIQMDEETINKRNRLAAKIYHDYLDDNRGDKHVRSVVKTATKVYIRQHIKTARKNRHRLDRDLFLQAQNEIERNVECHSYKDFLNSKIFMQHATLYDGVSTTKVVQAPYIAQPAPDPKNVKPPGLESPSNQMASRLSRIPEERVWIPEDTGGKAGNDGINPSKSRTNPSSTTGSKNYSGSSGTQRNSTAAYPYYVGNGYQNPAPSAVGSDQASKSSDTTDFTDSSVDGVPPVSKTSSRKELKYARCHLQKPDVLPPCPHKPRTKTCGKIPTMATDDPASFFELLRGKLEKLAAAIERQKRESEKFVVVPDEDSNQILESHLSRVVLESPRGEHSPPNVGINTTRRVRHFVPQPTSGIPTMYSGFDPKFAPIAPAVLADGSPLTGVSGSFQRNSSHRSFDVPMTSVSSRKDTLPRNKQRSSDVASINMGIVPGIPNNSVPDVPTPVIPVDKTQMISAWIQTPNDHSRTRKSTKSRQTSDTFDVDPVPSFVNPVSSTGLIASHNKPKYSPLRPQPAGLLAQDPTMPLLDQPDAGTTIEEVKRRLIEETEVHESSMSDFYKHMNAAPSIETSSKIPPASAMIPSEDVNRSADETDTDSSTQTCPSNKQPMSLEPSSATTTVICKLPNEKYPYKVHLSSDYPITLGQLKNYLVPLHKGQKYRYFFRKRSNELEEYCNDNDQLPIYDGTTVRAKLEHITGDGYH